MELLKELEKLENRLEEEANEQYKIIDIKYYKHITFDRVKGEEEPLYLIEKEVDGKMVKQLQAGDRVIADILEVGISVIQQWIAGSKAKSWFHDFLMEILQGNLTL